MKITKLQAYNTLKKMFEQKGYSQGKESDMICYSWDKDKCSTSKLEVGHYVYAIQYGKAKLADVPKEYQTKNFFLNTLSGVHEEIVEYVRTHSEEFDKQFYKDHIANNYYGLETQFNDFELMPIEFIDEEMVACAMFKAVEMYEVDRFCICDDWFYSVYRRKPEILTQELYTLGARCFAEKRDGHNMFLDITPEIYRTTEYYFALCLENTTPVMEDIPEAVLTTSFLKKLFADNIDNIRCFSEHALERELFIPDKGVVKFWQAAVMKDGYQIRNIPLNDDRVDFFLALYDRDSSEYKYGFKNYYRRYLRRQKIRLWNNNSTKPNSMNSEATIKLPIHYYYGLPINYAEVDEEGYLLDIYKKIGIHVLYEIDEYYYSVVLPEGFHITQENCGYCLKNSKGEAIMHYRDRLVSNNRMVSVDQIFMNLCM